MERGYHVTGYHATRINALTALLPVHLFFLKEPNIRIHPGEILLEEFLNPMGISQYRLAKDISIPAMRISKICKGKSDISADTALRLARYFGTAVEFWTGIQTYYDTERTRMEL